MNRSKLKDVLQIAKYFPLGIVYAIICDKLDLWQYIVVIVLITLFGLMWYLQGRLT